MPTPPALFDADLLALRRARAARIGGADFLQEAVADEIGERLQEVNRSFLAPAIVGPKAGLWAERLGLAGATLVADSERLDLAPGAHDLVVHALALHWANDPVGQLVQCRRALRPDGLLLAALFGGETLSELRQALAAAETATLGGLSPRVAPMGEIRDLGGLLQRVGFAMPVADSRRFDVSYGSAVALMRDLRAMGETNVMRERLRRPMPRAMLARTEEAYALAAPLPGGRIAATFEVIVLTGWAPAPGQPQPLRPGSATTRLEAALREAEDPSGER
ncbi:SAM-dependent methyltransferase [Amaricoccus macauensis]|uniref:SAM-dependent methyltransferase n=1 Tax=Amaricoccus macauensis TaxID=57001 RepID=A0A840SWF0_9RHOB|nr:methyltransferase domain-containing protein [Amaricoccus macauensis]MBB5223583.1 SAM-dependent methyltransferase [Amaricoccus macauensis]